ncbi:hypothetical protein Bca4012_066618 [Brassica carinata]
MGSYAHFIWEKGEEEEELIAAASPAMVKNAKKLINTKNKSNEETVTYKRLEVVVCEDPFDKSTKTSWAFCRLGYTQVVSYSF